MNKRQKFTPAFEAELDRVVSLLMQVPQYKAIAKKHGVSVQTVRYQIHRRTKIRVTSDETETKIAPLPEVP